MKEENVSKYTESGGLTIAYQIWEDPEDTLIYVPGTISHLEAALEDKEYLAWIRQLSNSYRLIIFDKRGQGLSDRDATVPNLEERMDGISSIVEAEKLNTFFLFGLSEGSSISLVYSATYPQKVKALAVFDEPSRSIESAISSIATLGEIDLKFICSLHVGKVIWKNDDMTGIAVNIAARALEKCPGNGVIITKNLRDHLGQSKFSVISMGDFALKGLEGNWELFNVEKGR